MIDCFAASPGRNTRHGVVDRVGGEQRGRKEHVHHWEYGNAERGPANSDLPVPARSTGLRLPMSAKPRTLVIRTAGTNCDAELCRAFEMAGSVVELVHVDLGTRFFRVQRENVFSCGISMSAICPSHMFGR